MRNKYSNMKRQPRRVAGQVNTHRLLVTNLDRVKAALNQQGVPFCVVAPPLPLWARDLVSFGSPRDQYAHLLDGFVGIACPLSGKQFHRLLVSLGVVS